MDEDSKINYEDQSQEANHMEKIRKTLTKYWKETYKDNTSSVAWRRARQSGQTIWKQKTNIYHNVLSQIQWQPLKLDKLLVFNNKMTSRLMTLVRDKHDRHINLIERIESQMYKIFNNQGW